MDLEFLKPLEIPFKIFKQLGFYQTKDSTIRYRIYGVLLHLLAVEPMVIGLTIPILRLESILHLSDVLCVALTYNALAFKSINLMMVLDDILAEIEVARKLIIFMGEKRSEFGQKIKARMKSVRMIFFFYWYSCLLTIHLAPLIFLITAKEPPYKIPYIMWAPFDYKHNYYGFIAMILIEYLSSAVYCGVVVSMDMLPIFFFNLSAGLLEELADRINSIDTTFHDTTAKAKTKFDDLKRQHDASLHNELQKCIEIHLGIRKFIANSQNIFSTMICAQAVISSIILCTTAYSISMVHNHLQCAALYHKFLFA